MSESANQRISESANERMSESANEGMSESANERMSESANEGISESANEGMNGAANEGISELANEGMNGAEKRGMGEKMVRWIKQNWGMAVILAALALFPFIFSVVTGTPVSQGPVKFWQGQLIVIFIMAVYAMSYDLLLGYTGVLSFGHAAFFGGGAYAMALFVTHVMPDITASYRVMLAGVNIAEGVLLLVGFVLALLVAIVLGLLFSVVSSRVKGAYFAMITLAMAEAIHILSKATDFVEWTGADEGLHGVPAPAWINPTQFRLRFYFVALIFAALMYFAARRIINSPTGRVFVALRENEERVQMIGYNPAIYRALAFTTAATIAGLAGALYALWTMSATPTMTSTVLTIDALIMTVLGGIGTLTGPMLGAVLMEFFGHFFYQWFGARWPLVFGVIFIALVIFLPYGIVGTWQLRRAQAERGWDRLRKLVSGEKSAD